MDPSLGALAQLVEQLTLNQRVRGSSPWCPTSDNARKRKGLRAFPCAGRKGLKRPGATPALRAPGAFSSAKNQRAGGGRPWGPRRPEKKAGQSEGLTGRIGRPGAASRTGTRGRSAGGRPGRHGLGGGSGDGRGPGPTSRPTARAGRFTGNGQARQPGRARGASAARPRRAGSAARPQRRRGRSAGGGPGGHGLAATASAGRAAASGPGGHGSAW